MKILVAGGAGYVGGYLVDRLKNYGHDITVYDSLVYENHYLKNVPFIYGDIRDREKLSSILPEFNTVIWLAAIVGDGACAIDPFLTQSINEDSVKWLVDNYKGQIVFPSTCSVYGINNELIDELAVLNPISVYAKTKLAAEQYIVNNAKDYLVFRLGTLFGLGDECSRIRLDLVVNLLAKKAALGESLTVFGGQQWRPLMHVKDATTAIIYAMGAHITGLYNLSYKNFTIKKIAQEISNVLGYTDIKYVDSKFEDQRNYRVSCERFEKLGWRPSHTLKEGILEIYQTIKDGRLKDTESVLYSNEYYLDKNYSRI